MRNPYLLSAIFLALIPSVCFAQISMDEVDRQSFGAIEEPEQLPSVIIDTPPVSLSGLWTLQGIGDDNRNICVPARVPCSIHQALFDAGVIPDPMIGRNDTLAARRSYQSWRLSKTFDYDGKMARPTLLFRGVANRCSISLNGTLLGHHEGMFGGPEYDVGELIRPGENTIDVDLEPIPEDCQWKSYPTENGSWKYTVVINCVYGWHYSCIPSLGIWDDVLLHDAHNEIVNPFIKTLSTSGDIRLSFSLSNPFSGEIVVRVGRTGRSKRPVIQVPVSDVSEQLTYDFHIRKPALWWPNGVGEQPLYEAEIQLISNNKSIASNRVRFGIRTLEMAPLPDGPREDLYNWTFVVNGRPMFVKGTGWCTCDALLRFTRDRYLRFLLAAKEQHVQILRAWGGGLPETDTFYELCDSLGIMVIQEWPTAWGTDRTQNRQALEETVIRNTLRLRNHPSLVMWGGGNETADPTGPVIDMMGAYSISLDGTRPFHRGEPYGGSRHNYYCWWERAPLNNNLTMTASFWGEFGLPSVPVRETVEQYLAGEKYSWPLPDDSGFEHHTPVFGVADDMDRLLQYSDCFTSHTTIEGLIAGTQWAQVEGVRHTLERARTRWPDCSGALSYKLNDNYPAVSWSSVDWYGRKKPMHYFMKSAFEPVTTVLLFDRTDLRGSECDLPWFFLDDMERFAGKKLSAHVRVYDKALNAVMDTTIAFKPEDRVKQIGILRLGRNITDSDLLFFISEVFHGRRQLSRKWYFSNYETAQDILFGASPAKLNVFRLGKTVMLKNISRVPAIGINVESTSVSDKLTLSDNFLWLDPGERKIIKMNIAAPVEVSWLNKQPD